jgi:hypothetical protein
MPPDARAEGDQLKAAADEQLTRLVGSVRRELETGTDELDVLAHQLAHIMVATDRGMVRDVQALLAAAILRLAKVPSS